MRIHKRTFEPLVSNNLVIQAGKRGAGLAPWRLSDKGRWQALIKRNGLLAAGRSKHSVFFKLIILIAGVLHQAWIQYPF